MWNTGRVACTSSLHDTPATCRESFRSTPMDSLVIWCITLPTISRDNWPASGRLVSSRPTHCLASSIRFGKGQKRISPRRDLCCVLCPYLHWLQMLGPSLILVMHAIPRIVGYAIEECPDTFLDGLNLLLGSFNLQDPSDLIDVHFGSGRPLHRDNGCTTFSNHDPNVISQFHFVLENLGRLHILGFFGKSRRASQPIASPEFGLTIVASRCQHVSAGMPLQIPNGHVVCIGNPCDRIIGSLGTDIPKQQGPIHSTGCKDGLKQGMPCQGSHFLVMSLERTELLHDPNIINLDELVTTRGEEPVSIVVPCNLGDCVFVSVQCAQCGSGTGVPEFD
mmetsp:Transcript_27974/g.64795  ORF Transcript_27974/g.64795 Transcript_27974/m.64795 type:complete len:335 (-) Transcript_27974:272-1276(-)